MLRSTDRSQVHREDVVEARALFDFVAGAAVCAVELEVALLYPCYKPASRVKKGGKMVSESREN